MAIESGRTATFIVLEARGLRLRGRLLDGLAPEAVSALRLAIPLSATAIHDQWSGELFRILTSSRLPAGDADRPAAFQHPGLLVLDSTTGSLALCYGQGRLQDGFGPLRAVPLAQFAGDLETLVTFGHALQFQGATPLIISASGDQTSPLADPPSSGTRRIIVTLDGVQATARLVTSETTHAAEAFTRLLPLVGRATNTHSSGPLVRFWNPAGGPEGETPLETRAIEAGQVILYPGYIYYLPTPPWRGIRIAAREATVMKGAIGGGGSTRLLPLARFEGDWSAFSHAAEGLATTGARELSFELA